MPTGSCLCRAVTFEMPGPLAPAIACHCTQCRKQSGHFWASTDVKKADLHLAGEANVRWFQSSPKVRRGFCAQCGSALFWDAIAKDTIGVSMGSIDAPTETRLALHIFTAFKGDYYELGDGVPRNEH